MPKNPLLNIGCFATKKTFCANVFRPSEPPDDTDIPQPNTLPLSAPEKTMVSVMLKAWHSLWGFLVCLPFLVTQPAVAAEKLVLASIPYRQEATLLTRFEPLIELLSRKLGRQIELDIAESYEDIGERLHHRVADIGVLGPKSYVEAKEKYPDIIYLATTKSPKGFYHSLIITRKDSGLDSLSALKEKSFAYTQTGSTSGYLYPASCSEKRGSTRMPCFRPPIFSTSTTRSMRRSPKALYTPEACPPQACLKRSNSTARCIESWPHPPPFLTTPSWPGRIFSLRWWSRFVKFCVQRKMIRSFAKKSPHQKPRVSSSRMTPSMILSVKNGR